MKTTFNSFLLEINEYKGNLNKLFNLTCSEMKAKWRELENNIPQLLVDFEEKNDINDIINKIGKKYIYDISLSASNIKQFVDKLIINYNKTTHDNTDTNRTFLKYVEKTKDFSNITIAKIDNYEDAKQLSSPSWALVERKYFNIYNEKYTIYFVFDNYKLISSYAIPRDGLSDVYMVDIDSRQISYDEFKSKYKLSEDDLNF